MPIGTESDTTPAPIIKLLIIPSCNRQSERRPAKCCPSYAIFPSLNHLKLKHSQGEIDGNSAELNAVILMMINGPNR